MTQNTAAPFKAVLEATHIDIAINKKTIIHDLSLAIPEGKITAIIGPNGCGKSTTLKAIARILPCAKGASASWARISIACRTASLPAAWQF